MRRTRRLALLALLLAAGAVAPAAHAADAHSHGIARLDVAVDGPTITVRLASPLESLLGFERAPRNEAERGLVQSMAQALRSGHPFVPTPAARCRLEWVKLTSPVLPPPLLDGADARAADKAAGEHADLDARFIYRCEDGKALQGIDVMLFDTFKRLRRVDAQVAGPKGQSALKLNSRARQIRW